MFKHKYLKQLQDVQARIKNNRATMASLNIPIPSCKITRELCDWLEVVTLSGITELGAFEEIVCRKLNVETFEYLGQLGNYFVNIADYERSKGLYEDELRCLQKQERHLKNKLGIE